MKWPSIAENPKLELPQSLSSLSSEDASPETWPTIHQPVSHEKPELTPTSQRSVEECENSESKQSDAQNNESPLGNLRFNDDEE